jgi:hypothetical protein
MKKALKNFFQDKFNSILMSIGLLLNIAGWLVLHFKLDFEKPLIILHYNSYLGIDRIVYNSEMVWPKVYLVPFLAVIVLLLNSFLAFSFSYFSLQEKENLKEEEDFPAATPRIIASRMLVFSACALQIIVLVYTFSIVKVNS